MAPWTKRKRSTGSFEPDRQRRVHRRHLVAERAARGVGADGDRHHRLELLPFGIAPVPEQVRAQRARHHRQHDVVDRPAERVLDRLQQREVGVGPREPAVRADPDVQRRRRRARDPGCGHRASPAAARPASAPASSGRDSNERAKPNGGRTRSASESANSSAAARQRSRGERCGRSGLDRIGLEVEEHGQDVDARDAVHECVVGLADQRETAVAELVDEPDLPQRLLAVELL